MLGLASYCTNFRGITLSSMTYGSRLQRGRSVSSTDHRLRTFLTNVSSRLRVFRPQTFTWRTWQVIAKLGDKSVLHSTWQAASMSAIICSNSLPQSFRCDMVNERVLRTSNVI